MKVILVDPSSSDTRWRFKNSLREAGKGIESRMKNCNLTASSVAGPSYPLVFRNSHIRKNMSHCGLALEETTDSKACSKVQSSFESPSHLHLQRKLIFKDGFGQGCIGMASQRRIKRCADFKVRKNVLVPTKGELTFCGSQQKTSRPDLSRSNLKVIDFRCPSNESKIKTSKPKGIALTGVNEVEPRKKAGTLYDKLATSRNLRDSAKEPYKIQSFYPSESSNSDWKLKKYKKGVRSDSSSLTCTFRVVKNGIFSKAER